MVFQRKTNFFFFGQAFQKLGKESDKGLLRISHRYKYSELNYFDIDGVHILGNLHFIFLSFLGF